MQQERLRFRTPVSRSGRWALALVVPVVVLIAVYFSWDALKQIRPFLRPFVIAGILLVGLWPFFMAAYIVHSVRKQQRMQREDQDDQRN